jgi:signal transduction histidine kinase
MNAWTIIQIFCLLFYSGAIFYVIIKNPYSVVNWVLAILFCYFAEWSACNVIICNTFVDINTANMAMKYQSIGWASFITYYFLFILFLTNNKKLLSASVLYFTIIIIPGIFIFEQFQGNMLGECIRVPYGYTAVWKNSMAVYCYFAYCLVMTIGGAWILFNFKNKSRSSAEKKTADILLSSVIVVFVIGAVIRVIMKKMGEYIPIDINVVFLIFVGGLIYCAEKYDVFTLTGAKTSDKIMEIINEGIVLIDNDVSVVSANRAALVVFGYGENSGVAEAGKFIGEKISLAGVKNGSPEVENYELSFIDALGAAKTVLISSKVLSNEKSNPGWVCTIRNITDKKQTEIDLVSTVKELTRSNEELESFAYVASHDLKEPLRMVKSYVELIQKRFTDKLGSDGNDFINFASEGALRMSDLIEDLLVYSRVRNQKKEFSDVNIRETVAKTIDLLKLSINDKKASVSISGELPVIKGDAIQIEQLLINLLGNALKFSGTEPVCVVISAEKNEGFYKFKIKDNGIGLEMEYSNKIFQIFQRLNSRAEYEGTGMGLAICRKIVENHNGKIWVESEGRGKGCSFYFTIPV